MKKVLSALIFFAILTNLGYGEENQNTPNPPTEKESIDLPIIKAPVQTSISNENSTDSPSDHKEPQNTSAKKIKQPSSKPSQTKKTPEQEFLKENTKPKKVIFIQEEFYEPKKNELVLEKKEKELFLIIHSKELQKFMEGAVYQTKQQVQTFALEDSFTQITNINGKIYEYKYAQKSIDRYSAIAPYEKYPLKKVSIDRYRIIIDKIPQIFDIKGCKIVIKKELSGTLNQRKEVIINLDTKRELRNNSHFVLFLECPK
ncbi:hypothetical protein BKH41_07425 [Helicobacter sp. 12S02232-10]|uniref:cell surface protein n=1 Tax=Helicobacter sp. 12S02232-10 TaxID=1476197 RepID=UPI000BA67E03|nr:cell surface protein [Helicobacter sp. 12S02232-10]PAF47408.1 hypothetical protein BKH41_07425 [Helicobacter sp. 12S02232-10]